MSQPKIVFILIILKLWFGSYGIDNVNTGITIIKTTSGNSSILRSTNPQINVQTFCSLSSVVGRENEQIELNSKLNKRTFCNAFTGCGRKRSDASMPTKDYEYESTLGDTLGEGTGVGDDLPRDVLAGVRLWEALQGRSYIRSPIRQQGFFPLSHQRRSSTFS